MAYGILLTTLYASDGNNKIRYYHGVDGDRMFYCDAMLAGEASSKYILSKYHIDEIITIGSTATYNTDDELDEIVLREGKSFFGSDINDLSSFDLMRYRLAEFMDELSIEKQDILSLLQTDERELLIQFLNTFFEETINSDGICKLNRFFHYLSYDKELYNKFTDELGKVVSGKPLEDKPYMEWIKCYLYTELKESFKFELRDGNANARIKFISSSLLEGETFRVGNIQPLIDALTRFDDDEVNLYIGIHSDNATDTYLLMNILELIKSLPEGNVKVNAIITTSNSPKDFSDEIFDDTDNYDISELVSGYKAFIDYGKVDRLLSYWGGVEERSPYVDSVLYALRDVDNAVSLCDITSIKQSIAKLRGLISEADSNLKDDNYSRLFRLVLDGVCKDYGEILTANPSFISLVKWAFNKKFYQQTMTIIESLAPDDFVDRGIFYYCDKEEEKEKLIRILGAYYAELKPFEKWRLDNISHYFIKNYGRSKAPRTSGSLQTQQKSFADYRISTIDEDDYDSITAYTICDDHEALRDLLFSYYYIGAVRNFLNHAESSNIGDDSLIATEAEVSTRMRTVTDTLAFFIMSYDNVDALIKDKTPNVLYVDHKDVVACGNEIFRESKKKNNFKKDEN